MNVNKVSQLCYWLFVFFLLKLLVLMYSCNINANLCVSDLYLRNV